MPTAEIVDLTTIARGFPRIGGPEIGREFILDTIDKVFEGKVDALLVEGEEGVGKTVLLSQFAKRHYKNTISLFVRPASRAAIDPAYIAYVLAEQIHWILHGETLPPETEAVSEADLLSYFSALERKLFRKKSHCFVIVDGLEDPSTFTQQVAQLTLNDLLPFGLPSFRYLISGSVDHIGRRLHKSLVVRPFSVPYCSLDDAVRFLDGLSLEMGHIEDLYRLSKKLFGRLATVRRLLQTGTSAARLLDEAPPDFIDLEWKAVATSSSLLKEVLSIVAFAQGSYDVRTICAITNFEEAQVTDAIQRSGFLIQDPSGEVSFCSDAHRRFAQRRLTSERERVLDILISFHSKLYQRRSEVSPLAEYLREASRHRDLLAFLDTKYFVNIAETTQSLTAIQQGTSFGYQASLEVEDFGSTMRFVTQSAFLLGLSAGETTRAEIEARTSVGDKALAISLAQRASLKENRIELLAATAAALRKWQDERDDALMGQIWSLIDQVDFSSMGQRAIDVAADLARVDPEAAFTVIQRSVKADAVSDTVDDAFAMLAMATLKQGHARTARTTADKGRSKVKDPNIQEFLTSLSLFLGTAPSREVIQHAETLEPSRGIFFLRQWAEMTRAFDEAGSVLEYALDMLLRTTAYTPSILDFRELATPLPHIKDAGALAKLIQRFDSQRATVLDLGTNEDLTRLQLLLAEAESVLSVEKAHRRFLEIYWQTSDLKDLSTKAACLSWMVSHFHKIDRDGSFERKEGALGVLRNDLAVCLEALLASTAEHFNVAQGALRAFAKTSIANALALADSLNAVTRRDDAYREIVRYACRPTLATDDIEGLERVIRRISNYTTRDAAISILVGAFCHSDVDFGQRFKSLAASLCNLCQTAAYSSMRAGALADMYDCIKRQRNESYRDLEVETLGRVNAAWSSIDTVWRKAQVAFLIAKNLGKSDPQTARTYIKNGEELKESAAIVSESQFKQYRYLVKLLIRAATGLLPNRLEDDASLLLLEKSINAIPSPAEKASLWAELACRAFVQGRRDVCEDIVSKHVRPLYDLITSDNDGAKWHCLDDIAPALFLAHQATFFDRVRKVPPEVQEDAADSVIYFILRKTPLDDAFVMRPHSAIRIRPDDVLDIFSLFHLLSTDASLYFPMVEITDYVLSRRGRQDFSKQNLADIADRIEQLVLPRLPDNNNIKHQGYVLATRAQIMRLRLSPLDQWLQLAALAEKIPNTADRAFVLLAIAGGMAPRFTPQANEIFRAAKLAIDSIPATLDRVDRLSLMAEEIMDVNQPLAKECIKSAYDAACVPDDAESFEESRRELIDLAHNIDPDFANDLVKHMDDDPARVHIRSEAKERIRTLKLEKSMSTSDANIDELSPAKDELAQAAWRALGLLNAGWMEPAHISQLRKYVPHCVGCTLAEAYPVLSWIVENLVRRTSASPASKSIFSNLLFALAQMSEAALAIISGTGEKTGIDLATLSPVVEGATQSSIVIDPGERDRALSFLTKWIDEHVEDYIRICDPYFTAADLELVRLVRGAKKDCQISVLTSKKVQQRNVDLAEIYLASWKSSVSPHPPGNCEIVIVGTVDKGELPIHDRWWITKGFGLRLGTSFNSLGITKTSDISVLDNREAAERQAEIDALLSRSKREHNGVPLGFLAVAL